MQLWRFRTSRSLRRSAERMLRRGRTEGQIQILKRRFGMMGRSADVRPPLIVATALHMVLISTLAGHATPAWLDVAWQVSASLVGLGVALVIFLLQAAASQSVASRSTYRAMTGATGLIWPAMMALVFIVAAAFAERWGGTTPPPSWAETFALALFSVQIATFGAAFVRTLSVVTPGGVTDVIERAFADLLHAAVERDLRHSQMQELWTTACDKANISHVGLFARGSAVSAGRDGRIEDLDTRLPGKLSSLGLERQVTLVAVVGRPVNPKAVIARLTTPDRAAEHKIRKGTKIGRLREEPAPTEVFDDVIDLCRREMLDGSSRSMLRTWRLVVSTLAGLPDVYARWEVAGSDRAAARLTETRLLRQVRDFNGEVLGSNNAYAVLLLPELAAGLVDAGLDADGSTLVSGASMLWLRQVAGAIASSDQSLGERLRDKVGQLAYQAVLVHQARLEDENLPASERLAALPGLEQLFDFQLAAMRMYAEASSAGGFVSLWHHWVTWARHWTPETDVEDLELEVRTGAVELRRRAADELVTARALVEAKAQLQRRRRDGMFVLGASAMSLWQNGQIDEHAWNNMVGYFASAIPSVTGAMEYALLPAGNELDERLEAWQLGRWDGESGWAPPDAHGLAHLWAVALLLKNINLSPASRLQFDMTDEAAQSIAYLEAQIAHIESDPERWRSVVGPEVSERAGAVRKALRRATVEARARADVEIREAPIDSARVAQYVETQVRAYAIADLLRPHLLLGDGVAIAEPTAPVATNRIKRVVYSKRAFTAIGEPMHELDDGTHGRRLGEREMVHLYEAVLPRSVEKSSDASELRAVDLAVEAIAELRGTSEAPDAVLIPHDAYLRAQFSKHPEWAWTTSAQHLATLSGVPVYDIAPREATWLVVARLAGAIKRVEHAVPPLSISVKPLSRSLAESYMAQSSAVKGWSVEEVIDRHVEVELTIDVVYQDPPRGRHTAFRIELPPPGERRHRGST